MLSVIAMSVLPSWEAGSSFHWSSQPGAPTDRHWQRRNFNQEKFLIRCKHWLGGDSESPFSGKGSSLFYHNNNENIMSAWTRCRDLALPVNQS